MADAPTGFIDTPNVIEVRDSKGTVYMSVPAGDVIQHDGPPMAFNLQRIPYETFVFARTAPAIEELQDHGLPELLIQVREHLEKLIAGPPPTVDTFSEPLHAIEWRLRPKVEWNEDVVDATILDQVTGAPRPGKELQQRVSIRYRLIAHK